MQTFDNSNGVNKILQNFEAISSTITKVRDFKPRTSQVEKFIISVPGEINLQQTSRDIIIVSIFVLQSSRLFPPRKPPFPLNTPYVCSTWLHSTRETRVYFYPLWPLGYRGTRNNSRARTRFAIRKIRKIPGIVIPRASFCLPSVSPHVAPSIIPRPWILRKFWRDRRVQNEFESLE